MDQANSHSSTDSDSLVCLNKKRKFEAEQLGMPLPKQVCAYNQSFAMKYGSLLDHNQDYETETAESGKGSNSIAEDVDSAMSGEAKPCSSTCASTSSLDTLYSLESRSVARSSNPYGSKECDVVEQNFGWLRSLSRKDLLSHIKHHVDCSCLECGNERIEAPTDQEVEDMLYSNGVIPNNFVLSSGRWKVDQESEEGAKKKLTIDKEFEQYFGMLMLK